MVNDMDWRAVTRDAHQKLLVRPRTRYDECRPPHLDPEQVTRIQIANVNILCMRSETERTAGKAASKHRNGRCVVSEMRVQVLYLFRPKHLQRDKPGLKKLLDEYLLPRLGSIRAITRRHCHGFCECLQILHRSHSKQLNMRDKEPVKVLAKPKAKPPILGVIGLGKIRNGRRDARERAVLLLPFKPLDGVDQELSASGLEPGHLVGDKRFRSARKRSEDVRDLGNSHI